MTTKRALIIGRMPARSYSGGRYHAFCFAVALAELGYKVTFLTTNRPSWASDFDLYPCFDNINFDLGFLSPLNSLGRLFVVIYDLTIVIPDLLGFDPLYQLSHAFSKVSDKLWLIDFESPDWYNSSSGFYRDPSLWDAWLEIAKFSDLIISSTQLGKYHCSSYLHKFGIYASQSVIYPPINSLIANNIDNFNPSRRSGVIVPLRLFKGEHKGIDVIDTLSAFESMDIPIHIIADFSNSTDLISAKIKRLDGLLDGNLYLHESISDSEKFSLLANSQLMIFPSKFEGFGLPPVEAAVMNLPCVSFNLPVFAEVTPFRNTMVDLKSGYDELVNVALNLLNSSQESAFDQSALSNKYIDLFGFSRFSRDLRAFLP